MIGTSVRGYGQRPKVHPQRAPSHRRPSQERVRPRAFLFVPWTREHTGAQKQAEGAGPFEGARSATDRRSSMPSVSEKRIRRLSMMMTPTNTAMVSPESRNKLQLPRSIGARNSRRPCEGAPGPSLRRRRRCRNVLDRAERLHLCCGCGRSCRIASGVYVRLLGTSKRLHVSSPHLAMTGPTS